MCNGVGLKKERKKALYFESPLLRHGYSTELQALFSPKYTLSYTRPL